MCEYALLNHRMRNERNSWDYKHQRPTTIFGETFECEHIWWDPKDGELCLSRVKSGETLMEARSGTDVQIVRHTVDMGAKD